MKEQKHSYSQRIGKTTFIVNVKQSESAKFRKSTKSILTNSTPRAADTAPKRDLRSSTIYRS